MSNRFRTIIATVLAAIGIALIPMGNANATESVSHVSHSVTVSAHVQHMRHVLHVLNTRGIKHYPTCRNEDGSGQWYCKSGASEGVRYLVRVVKVYNNGDVLRRYHYSADGHNEYVREGF